MDVSIRDVATIKVVGLEGDLDTNTAPDAEQHLNQTIADGATKILLNLEKLEYTSSAGLRVLLSTAKKLKAAAGSLRICCLNETVEEVFEISGFDTILDVFATEAEALAGF